MGVFLLFWNEQEIPNNVSLLKPDPVTGQPIEIGGPVLRSALLIDFWLLGGLGLAGVIILCVSKRRKPLIMVLPIFIILYCFSIVIFYMLGRFRLPIYPLLAITAAYIVNLILMAIKTRRTKHFGAKMISIFLSFIFVYFFYDYYRNSLEPSLCKIASPNGVQVQLADRFLIKDNGPSSFGGWETLSFYTEKTSHTVEKTFKIEPDPKRIRGGRLKLSVGNHPGARYMIRIPELNFEKSYELNPKELYINIELKETDIKVSENGQFTIRFFCEQLSPQGQLYIDWQRNYGRTLIDQQAIDAELVMALELFLD